MGRETGQMKVWEGGPVQLPGRGYISIYHIHPELEIYD